MKRLEFETAILEARDRGDESLDTSLVYADWLQGIGDPLGEVITLQCALEDHTLTRERRAELKEREETILIENRDAWLGELGHFEDYPYRWRRGFLERIDVTTPQGKELIEAIAAAPAARFLREMECSVEDQPSRSSWADPIEASDAIEAIQRVGLPASLRELSFRVSYSHSNREDDFSLLYPRWQQLKRLRIDCPKILGTMDLPALEELVLDYAHDGTFDELEKAANLQRVTLLDVMTDDWQLAPRIPGSARLPRVRELAMRKGWRRAAAADVRNLALAPILRRIAFLDLDHVLDQDSTTELVKHLPAFAHLGRISLRGCPFTSAEEAALKKVFEDRVVLGE